MPRSTVYDQGGYACKSSTDRNQHSAVIALEICVALESCNTQPVQPYMSPQVTSSD